MEETSKKKLNAKQQVFVDEYLRCFNGAEAARRAGYAESRARQTGHDLLTDSDISLQIQSRLAEVHMSADEALKLTADIARGDLGVFFKIVDEWVFFPLPSYDILDEREVIDETKDPPEKRISYRVRHVALDMDKVIDPQYSWMLKSFSDSSKFGLKIEAYDRYAALRDIAKMHGKFVEKMELTGKDGAPLQPKEDDGRFDRAIESLADALREVLSNKGNGEKSKMDTTE